jgi:hypothetical protein
MQVPAQHMEAEGEGLRERRQERRLADRDAGFPVLAQADRVDLRPGQERQHGRAQHRQKPGDRRLIYEMLMPGGVGHDRTDHYLDHRHRDPGQTGVRGCRQTVVWLDWRTW